jgi:glycosyltransferase involved in cell wall biosynthesis
VEFAFVGSVIPEELGRETRAFSVAGNKFQGHLLARLQEVHGRPVRVLSQRPVAAFPEERPLAFGRRRERLDHVGLKATLVPFLNVPVAKEVSLAATFFAELMRWSSRLNGAQRVIVVYNVFSPHALSVLAASRLTKAKSIAIIADLPHDVYRFRGAKGVLERMDFAAQLRSIKRFSGLVVLTPHIAEDFAPGVPHLVVEGGVEPAEMPPLGPPPDGSERALMYSGALNDINGIRTLLDAFALLPEPEYRLWIYGGGPLEGEVRAAAERDGRIVFGGMVPNDEVLRRQRQATVLVNPRPTGQRIARYTFPSKVLEYLGSGTPVVSTVLPGIPGEYHPHLRLAPDTAAGLAEAVRALCALPAEERRRRGAEAREFVLRNKSWERQARRVHDFISSL